LRVIRFDFDDRYAFEPAERALPWFARVLIADFAFYLIFAFFVGPWIALLWLLWPQQRPVQVHADEDRTPIVFLQPQEIPRALLRPPPITVKAPPAPKPADHIVLPGNTRPFEPGDPPAPQPTKAPEPPQPEPPRAEPQRPEPEAQIARNTAVPPPVSQQPARDEPRPPVSGPLGRALQNLDRYAAQTSGNPLGSATEQRDASFQFDPKGVDFGPWLRKFRAKIVRNWDIPNSAMFFHGHAVLHFLVHRDGTITDLRVLQPASEAAFTTSSHNAIRGTNPADPLPVAYPDESIAFTVTFYYNEEPPN
jgi:outer membrane biosynthesis protein TonB